MSEAICIIVVEDEELIRRMLEEALKDGGFSIDEATSGEEAISLLKADETKYKALITDINLSGELSGWEVAKYAREINDRIPVVYMTGASAHDWASKGVPNSLLMPKPFAVAQVVTAVSLLINAAAHLSLSFRPLIESQAKTSFSKHADSQKPGRSPCWPRILPL